MARAIGAALSMILLGLIGNRYMSLCMNMASIAGSVVVFGLALWLVRSQATVGDFD